MRGKPEVVLIEMVKGDRLTFSDGNRNLLHPFFYRVLIGIDRLDEMMEMIHEQDDLPVTVRCAMDLP